jgi:glycosyltransferase involved in cell wall biosynthesis
MATSSETYVVVCMPTANCRQWLHNAIESILRQRYSHLDLYVVDDDSGDVDETVIRQFPSVSFLRMARPSGPYAIDNMILRLTDSDFVAFQDADDRSHADRIGEQVAYLQQSGLDGCGTWSVNVDISGDPIGYHTPPEVLPAATERRQLEYLFHPTSMYRRGVVQALGGFDEHTFFGADTEFLFRCLCRYRLGNVPRLLYQRTVHPGSLTHRQDTGHASFLRKQYNAPLFQAIDGIIAGERMAPSPGYLLNGDLAGGKTIQDFSVMQIGRGNRTWAFTGEKQI